MTRSHLMLIAAFVAASFSAHFAAGQFVITASPTLVPSNSQVLITASNDTPGVEWVSSIGPIVITDINNAPVLSFHALLFVAIPVQPGEVLRYFDWHLNDDSGNPVPPGLYTINATVNGMMTTESVLVGVVDAAVGSVGVFRPGTTRHFFLTSPLDAGGIYAMAASFSVVAGITTCGGIVPLDNDFLFTLSTTPNNGAFHNTFGLLEPNPSVLPGGTVMPSLTIPPIPALSGFQFNVAFVVVDPTQTCPIVRISFSTLFTVF